MRVTKVEGKSFFYHDNSPHSHLLAPFQEGVQFNLSSRDNTNGNMSQSGLPSGLDVLSLDMKDLLKKIQHLSHLGIEDSNIRLPKICVVGDQSTGKSSVIEAISEIKVPRSEGTCTRCPLEINLSESKQGWSCSVYLSPRYWFDPGKKVKRGETDGTKKLDRLGPWVRLENRGDEDEFFITLTEKSKLKDTISWAQRAILNPSSDSQEYVPGKNIITSTSDQVKFSPNVVRLDISAPEFPTLSFFDLPGVINQAETDEEKYLVGLIDKLVRQYVSQANCIVLLTLSMTNDATNSSAARIIRDIRGAKERTMGVLTKPDRLASGHNSFLQWSEILEGDKFQLGHGYFVVRNNPDVNVDHAQAREEENTFFANPFWAGQMASFQDRFGVSRLQSALSVVLMEQIKKCLPSIVIQIDEKAFRIDRELRTLPDPPTDNVQHIVLESVIKLGSRIESIFSGGAGSRLMQKFWNELVTDFKKALAVTRPTVNTIGRHDDDGLREKDPDCEIVPGPTPARLKRKAPGPIVLQPSGSEVSAPENRPQVVPTPMYMTSHFENWKQPRRVISIDEVRLVKQETQQVGIPNQIDPAAIETLKRESVQHWEGIATDFAKALLGVVNKVLLQTLGDAIVSHRQTELYRQVHRIIDTFLARIEDEYLGDIASYCRMEQARPFTLAEQRHKEETEKALRVLLARRKRNRVKKWLRIRKLPEDENIDRVTDDDLGPDPYAQELEMVAVSDP